MLQPIQVTVCDALDQVHELALLLFEFSEFHLDIGPMLALSTNHFTGGREAVKDTARQRSGR